MQDNAPSHASQYTSDWLASKGFKDGKMMTWPPFWPDLNPIENLWALLKREIYSQGKQYTSLNSLWASLLAASAKIGRDLIKKLAESVDMRLIQVLEKKGGYIGK